MVDFPGTQERLEEIADGFDGRVGYAFTRTSTGERLVRLPDDRFPSASTIKLPILSALHIHAAEHQWNLDERVRLGAHEIADGSGILQFLSRELELSYRELMWLMICLSDNTATNVLVDTVGRDRVAGLIREHLDPAFELRGAAGAAIDTEQPSMGYATPAAFNSYLVQLAAGSIAGSDHTVEVLSQQVFSSMMPRYLPLSEPDRPLHVAHKTGALPGIRTDVGIIRSPTEAITVAVLTADSPVRSYDTINPSEQLIGALTYVVCRDWLGVRTAAGDAAVAGHPAD